MTHYKKQEFGIEIYIPDIDIKNNIVFFSYKNNFEKYCNEPIIDHIINNATVVVMNEENESTTSSEPVNTICTTTSIEPVNTICTTTSIEPVEMTNFIKLCTCKNVIGTNAVFNNKFKKPYTGIFTLLCKLFKKKCPEFKFNAEQSAFISDHIGINKQYKDRAFAENIGITKISHPLIFFNKSTAPIYWNYPYYVLSKREKCKLFKYSDIHDEPNISKYIFKECINMIIINGPPCSGKSLLAKRIKSTYDATYIIDSSLTANVLKDNLSGDIKAPPFNIDYNKYEAPCIFICIYTASTKNQRDIIIQHSKHFHQFELTNDSLKKNIIWIDMDIHRKVVNFLRHIQVQLNPYQIKKPFAQIKQYYDTYEKFTDQEIPQYITFIKFPVILKKIKELEYIF